MALIVQKYGGTSVGNPDRIKNVASRVANYRGKGDQVVVVVSAMAAAIQHADDFDRKDADCEKFRKYLIQRHG